MAFENILGNEKNKEILNSIAQTENSVHGYLWIGRDGIGKSLFATEFAKMLLCEAKEQKPCNKCKSCIEFEAKSHPDFMIIEPEDGKTIKIEQIRYMQEKIAEKPVTSTKKVYVIANSELMTREASNCLLKTLEEPPSYAIIILLTSNESKLLATIKSRLMKMYFAPIEEKQILSYLKENNLDTNITKNMLKQCEGSIGKAIKVLEEKEKYELIEDIIRKISTEDITTIWRKADVLYDAKEGIISLLEYMSIVLYEKLREKNEIKYANGINIIEKTKQRILANANYDMSIDNLLLELWEAFNL